MTDKDHTEPEATKKAKSLTLNQKIMEIRLSNETAYMQKIHEVSAGSGKFKALTHDEVIALFRKQFNEHKILMWINLVSSKQEGKMTEVEVDITLESGKSTRTTRWYGQGFDGSDKGAGKAYSYAIKTFFLKTFMVETGINEESSSIVDDALNASDISAPELQSLFDAMKEVETEEEAFVRYINGDKGLTMVHLSELPKRWYPYAQALLRAKQANAEKKQ